MQIKSIAKKAGVGAAGLALAGGFSVLATQPASAATYTLICNSDYSDEWIRWYGSGDPHGLGGYAPPSDCDNTGSQYISITYLRVDVDTTGSNSNGVDIDSYKIGEIDVGWGPCHTGETDSSNPPDEYANHGIRYRNYKGGSC